MTLKVHREEWEFNCRIYGSTNTVRGVRLDCLYCRQCGFVDLIEVLEEGS